MTLKEAIIKVLEESNEPLHVKKIHSLIRKKGYFDFKGKTAQNSIGATLSNLVKEKIVERKDHGIYASIRCDDGDRNDGVKNNEKDKFSGLTRADKIYEIIKELSGRAKVSDIENRLKEIEGAKALPPSIVSATVRQDNSSRIKNGKAVRFNIYGEGSEEFGYISVVDLKKSGNKSEILKDSVNQIPKLIQEANEKVKEELKRKISNLTWQEFESFFLTQILEALGFDSIEITQRTKDGGVDARCVYKRGLVKNKAIVSAKFWNSKKQKVGVGEVRSMHGIPGIENIGIIITTSTFTRDALKEAEPQQNSRAIVLIDIDQIIKICIENEIGVETVELPRLYRVTNIWEQTGE